jgi:hypothetical protein
VIPVADAVNKLTTATAVCIDPARHTQDLFQQLKPVLTKHKGKIPLYLQVPVGTNGEQQKVTIQASRDLSVRASKDFQDDVEMLLGHGAVQFHGAGSKRIKRLQQQALFKEQQADAVEEPAVPQPVVTSDEELTAQVDAEMELAEV